MPDEAKKTDSTIAGLSQSTDVATTDFSKYYEVFNITINGMRVFNSECFPPDEEEIDEE